MKFYKAMALCMALLLMALAAAGCGASNNPTGSTAGTTAPATVPTTEPTVPETTVPETTVPVTESATEATEAAMDPEELAGIYADYAMSIPDVMGYALVNLNYNANDALIVETGTCEADSMFHVYTWKQGMVTEVGEVAASHSALALDDNGDLIVFGGQMGTEWAYAVSYEDGVFAVKELYNRPYPDGEATQYENIIELTYTQE